MATNRTQERSNPEQPKRRSRRRRRGIKCLVALIYVAMVIGLSILLATVGWNLAGDVLALNKAPHSAEITLDADMFDVEEVRVEKDDGTTEIKIVKILKEGELNTVADMLHEGGIVQYKWLFKLFTTITKGEGKFQPGVFTLNTDMDYRAIITSMGSSSDNRATVKLTFYEGDTIDDIFELMAEEGVAPLDELQNMAANHDYAFSFLQDIPLGDYHRLEGYMFPDTYEFYVGEEAKYAINKLLVNFDAKFDDEMRQEVADKGYTIHEILTIASMIEKETDGTDEKRISSVIYNRLKNNGETAGFLQIDATIFYVTGRTVTADDYQGVDSPYNTYRNKGLPPGPISNPGMAAIKAAIEPESTNYYFYVLNPNTNRHEFTTNYDAHRWLVNQYYG